MTSAVHIVDYGAGNLYSVARAIEKVGGVPTLTSDIAEIAAADRLILPGVGAFPDGMRGLCSADLDKAVVNFSNTGRPLLGICLGMQMLATTSSEFGSHNGLGLIPGKVEAIPAQTVDGLAHKIPFIGWTELTPVRPNCYDRTALSSMKPQNAVYLVHSFHFVPEDPSDLLATYDYNGLSITAAIARENIIGCQFHPEKSGDVGLKIIDNFINGT
jgi:glutamine amidotransferase